MATPYSAGQNRMNTSSSAASLPDCEFDLDIANRWRTSIEHAAIPKRTVFDYDMRDATGALLVLGVAPTEDAASNAETSHYCAWTPYELERLPCEKHPDTRFGKYWRKVSSSATHRVKECKLIDQSRHYLGSIRIAVPSRENQALLSRQFDEAFERYSGGSRHGDLVLRVSFGNAPETPSSPMRRWIDLRRKLESFRLLRSGWNSYNAPPPSKESLEAAKRFLAVTENRNLRPSRITPSVVGGVGITIRRSGKKGFVEFYNSGKVCLLLSEPQKRALETFTFSSNLGDLVQVAMRIEEYLDG